MGFMIKAIHPKSFTTTQHFQDENGKVVGWDWCKNRPSSGGPKESGIVWPKWVGKARNLLRLGGGFKDFLFSPRKLGKSPNLTHIFQRGWNHQLVKKSKQWLNKTWFQVTGSCKIFWFLVKFWAFVNVTWVGTELIPPNLEVPMDFCLAQRWTRNQWNSSAWIPSRFPGGHLNPLVWDFQSGNSDEQIIELKCSRPMFINEISMQIALTWVSN